MKTYTVSLLSFLLIAFVGCKELPDEKPKPQGGPANSQTFLWVFDNSGSMTERRAAVVANMKEFLEILQSHHAFPYKMGVTTVDMFTDQGKLIASKSGKKIVDSTSEDPVKDFMEIVDNISDSATSFWEQGLESAYQAIQREPALFQKKDSLLNIIIVSDSNDYSCKDDCYGVEPENNPNWKQHPTSRYIEYFKLLTDANTKVSVFPMVGTVDAPCFIESVGARYIETVTGYGFVGSICNSHFKLKLLQIADTLSMAQ